MKNNLIVVAALLATFGGATAVLTATKSNRSERIAAYTAQIASEATAMKKGSSYISYADFSAQKATYKDAHVVLYFYAPWCPTCRVLDKDVTANVSNLPANTVIVKTDYDSSVSLKKKYGVTYQHTLVQIDANGEKVKKWSGSPKLKDVVSEIET